MGNETFRHKTPGKNNPENREPLQYYQAICETITGYVPGLGNANCGWRSPALADLSIIDALLSSHFQEEHPHIPERQRVGRVVPVNPKK
jgi:hypothetical protein